MFVMILLSCNGRGAGVVEEPLYSGDWERPQRSDLENLDLPPGPDGYGYTLLVNDHGTLWADPLREGARRSDEPDPVFAAGACGGLLIACVEPGVRNTRGCLENVAVCETEEPWNEEFCCPAGCMDIYIAHRKEGLGEIEASAEAIFGDEGCIPGMAEAIAEEVEL